MLFLSRLWRYNFSLILTFSWIKAYEQIKYSDEKCMIIFENSTYEIQITKYSENSRKDKFNIFNGKDDYHKRLRRSTYGGNSQNLDQEVFKLKRKIGRLERKLLQSMNDLSKEVTQGLRKIENKMSDYGSSGHSKRDLRTPVTFNPCPQDFTTIDIGRLQSCYLMSNFNTTWYEANEYCLALGSNLVAMETVQEHYVLTYLIKNHKDHSQATGWWTSGTFVAKTKQWMWATDISVTKPFTFIRWAPNQPDDDTSNCVYLRRDDNQLWNDEICSATFNFVCEKCFRC